MKDQHTKIKGYRDLSQTEIDLMNKIKLHGQVLQELINEVKEHNEQQLVDAATIENETDKRAEKNRLYQAQPARWAAIANTDLQTGLMALTRAVAQPTSF